MKKSQLIPNDPTQEWKGTPIAFIHSIIRAYNRYGISPDAAIAHAGISAADLANPTARVLGTQMELLSAYAMRELDDEALSCFSRRQPWGSYGMLCYSAYTAANLGIALKRWARHYRILTEDILVELVTNGKQAELVLTSENGFGEMNEFCWVSNLTSILGFSSWAVDSRIPLNSVEFPFSPPIHADIYSTLFNGPVKFDCDQVRVSFDARYLKLPICRDEPALQAMLQKPLPLLWRQYRRDRLLVERVHNLLKDQLS